MGVTAGAGRGGFRSGGPAAEAKRVTTSAPAAALLQPLPLVHYSRHAASSTTGRRGAPRRRGPARRHLCFAATSATRTALHTASPHGRRLPRLMPGAASRARKARHPARDRLLGNPELLGRLARRPAARQLGETVTGSCAGAWRSVASIAAQAAPLCAALQPLVPPPGAPAGLGGAARSRSSTPAGRVQRPRNRRGSGACSLAKPVSSRSPAAGLLRHAGAGRRATSRADRAPAGT